MTDFNTWKAKLARELCDVFDMTADEAARYIQKMGDECWLISFDEGLTPAEAAAVEASVALDCLSEEGL